MFSLRCLLTATGDIPLPRRWSMPIILLWLPPVWRRRGPHPQSPRFFSTTSASEIFVLPSGSFVLRFLTRFTGFGRLTSPLGIRSGI